MKKIDNYISQIFEDKRLQWFIDNFMVWSLSFVFIFFGALKVLDISPVRGVVEQTLWLFENDYVFLLLGVAEVSLGLGLLFKKTRKYAALLIIMHLLGIFATSLLNPSLIFDSKTIATTHGEFVAKNFVLIAFALGIVRDEVK